MPAYDVVILNEDKRPLAGVVVEAVSLDSWPTVSATGETGRNGQVQFSGLSGPHFFRPRVRRTSATVGGEVFTGQVEVQANSPSEGVNVDYVVDSTGAGSHATLFGATGALEAAIATGADRTIWVCTTHVETVEATHDITELASEQRIVVLSGGRNRPVINCDDTLGANPFIDHQNASSHADSTLIFRGLAFLRDASDSAVAGPFFQGNGGLILPRIELYDIAFEGDSWTYLFDFDTASSADVRDLLLEKVHTRSSITALFAISTSMATNGKLAIHNCDFAAMANIQERDDNTDVDLGQAGIFITDNLFRSIMGYGWTRTYPTAGASTHMFVFTGNIVLNFSGAASFLSIGTAGTTGPVDATISGNFIRCSSDNNATRAVTVTGGAGTAKNIAICGNSLQGPTGANAHIAVAFDLANNDCMVLNSYRDWDTNVGGSVGPGTGSFTGDHGSLAGLGDDDHTIYLLADGTRALSGNWAPGAFDLGAYDYTAKPTRVEIDDATFFFDTIAGTENVGNLAVGLTPRVEGDNAHSNATKVTLTAGTYTAVAFYGLANIGGRTAYLGIYDDNAGVPNDLQATTASFTPVIVAGWNEIALTAPVALGAGTYWIALLGDTGFGTSFTWYYDLGSAGDSYEENPDDDTDGLEDPWAGGASSDKVLSAYAVRTTGDPRVTFDTNDYLEYNRSSNYFSFVVGSTEIARLTSAGNLQIDGELEIDGDLNHDGSNIGFFAVAPVARATAYTQTYATADKTHANPTAAAVGDLVATSGGWGYSTEANADKVWDALDKLVADMADIKQLVNAVIDDLQAYGLAQ